jgi:isoleucyl-tRNA synthetase
VVRGADAARGHESEIAEELRVKEVSFDAETALDVTVKPNFPAAGPRLGAKIKEVAAALERGDYQLREDGGVDVAGETLRPEEVVRTERVILDGWVVAHDGGVSVAVDPALDPELVLEGRALELIRALNEQRKQEDLALTDRVRLRLPAEYADLVDVHGDWIAAEVLATEIEIDPDLDRPVLIRSEQN